MGTVQGGAEELAEQQQEAGPGRRLQRRQCQAYLQRTLAKEFPKIVEGFVKEAKKGSCSHMKLAAELLEPQKVKGRKKGTAQRLLESMSR